MRSVLAHNDGPIVGSRVIDGYVGSPMYSVIEEHGAAVASVILLVIAFFIARFMARRRDTAPPLWQRYEQLTSRDRFVAWLLAITTAAHAGLVVGHEPSGYTVLYITATVVLLAAARHWLYQRPGTRFVRIALLGSVTGYAVLVMADGPPDQVGIAVKLVELTALAELLRTSTGGRFKRLAASTAATALVVFTGFGAWIGAFASTDGGHHLGSVPGPGVLITSGEDREPTPEETRRADVMFAAVDSALAKYQDPARAAADGYDVAGMFGHDFHAENAEYKADDRIFDPDRPETLVYAVGPAGPVLLGAMFEMPDIGRPGPAIGGPLTVWHAHDHICVSLIPPALAGLTSPYGTCTVGSITVPITGEMIHVWTVPGAPERFGDLDDEWLAEYLATRS